MECKQVENLISGYIENELPRDVQKEVAHHLETCASCKDLKEKVEDLLYAFPELEEEVPFFLKNRLYYIPESQEEDNIIDLESRRMYLKWMAAVIGTFVLFLNLFYFTNIYPPANRILHEMVAGIKTFTVKTEAFYERVKESNTLFFLSSRETESEKDLNGKMGPDAEKDLKLENSMEKNIKNNGGKNG